MNFHQTLEKVEQSKVFQDLRQKNSDIELVAGFFILDFLSNDNKNSLDYKVPDTDKIYTFDVKAEDVLIKEDKLITDETNTHPKLSKIDPDIKVEVDEIKSIAGTEALDRGISAKFNKIIAVLQNYEDKEIWNLTCMLDQLIILNILIDTKTGKIIKFERKSMMDMIKKK